MTKAGEHAQLAPASGSLTQLMLATVPLFGVLLYFLVAAYHRPHMDEYNYDDDVYLEEVVSSRGAIIGLMPMLYTFMACLVLWSCLGVYLVVFVGKRRSLVEKYATTPLTVMGNVHYKPRRTLWKILTCGCFRPETAVVTYAHPDPDSVNRRLGTTYDIDGPARRKDWIVQRKVRTYKLYTRESVSIVLLPGLPLSGLAKTDVEVDIASWRMSEEYTKDRILAVCKYVILPWVAFTFFGGMFIVTRMSMIYDPYDNPNKGWKVFLITVLGVNPVLAVGWNLLRWVQYKNYITNSGKVIEGDRAKKLPTPDEEEQRRDDGGIFMANMCGAPSDGEIGIGGGGGGSGITASYRNMT